jgi:Fe-S cluster assembly scaffold protein SufB
LISSLHSVYEPIARELPMEYALELNRLIELQMEGAVG